MSNLSLADQIENSKIFDLLGTADNSAVQSAYRHLQQVPMSDIEQSAWLKKASLYQADVENLQARITHVLAMKRMHKYELEGELLESEEFATYRNVEERRAVMISRDTKYKDISMSVMNLEVLESYCNKLSWALKGTSGRMGAS